MATNKLDDVYVPRPSQSGRTITQIGNRITQRNNTLIQIDNTSNVASGDVYQRDNIITEEGNFTYQKGNETNEDGYGVNHNVKVPSDDITSADDLADQTKPIRGNLQPMHRQLLREHYEYLLEEIDAKYVSPHLFTKCIIDSDAFSQISQKTTRRERTQTLLEILFHSGPRRAFPEFINSLQAAYPDIAHKLIGQLQIQ